MAETADSRTHAVAVASNDSLYFLKSHTWNHLVEEHPVFQKLAWTYPPSNTPDFTMICANEHQLQGLQVRI